MTSLKQLSLEEFSGEEERPKVYENGHTNVLGIWTNSERKLKYSTILSFFYVKNQQYPSDFFKLKNKKKRRTTFIIDIFC